MIIDRNKLIEDLQNHIARYEWNITCKQTEYDKGYLSGLRFAVRIISLQPESEIGQVKFDFDCPWKEVRNE